MRRSPAILQSNEALAGEALRTLGVAFRALPAAAFEGDEVDERVEQELVFAGLIAMIDPPRVGGYSIHFVSESVGRYSVMSGLLPRRVKYAHTHWVITATRLRKPMSRNTCTTDHISHAIKPDSFLLPNSATARW
jgi:hypothetical protein